MKGKFAGLLNFWIFLVLSSGVILGKYLPFYFFFLFLSLFSLGAVYFFYKKNKLFISDIFVLTAFLFLGACLSSSSHNKYTEFLNKENDLTLQVVSLPRKSGLSSTFLADIQKINTRPLKIRARIRDYSKTMKYLGLYRLKAKLVKKEYKGRVFYYIWVKTKEPVEELALGGWSSFKRKTSIYILNVFKNNCSGPAARFLSSIFLGRRELLGEEKDFFTDAGAAHLLAISGLHLGLTSLILFFILRFFGLKFKTCLAVSMVFLYFYTFLAGASHSTMRAAAMYSVFAAGFFVKRKISSLNSLGLAGTAALIIEPPAVFSIGFQLSFMACFAIIAGFKIFKLRLTGNIVLSYFKQIIFCSFFVALFLTPLVSYYFEKIYILSILYNIILIPFFTFILILNFLLLIFSPWAFAALGLGEVLSVSISWFIALARQLSSIRFSFIRYNFDTWAVFFYYVFLILFLFAFTFGKHRNYNRVLALETAD